MMSAPLLFRFAPPTDPATSCKIVSARRASAFPGFNSSSSRARLRKLHGDVLAAPDDPNISNNRCKCRLRSELPQNDGVHAERDRIAQQIHDDLGGILTGLHACICVAMERGAQPCLLPDPLLADASALASLALSTVRTIAHSLRPIILEQMDLWDAVEWLGTQLARRNSIQFDYYIDASLFCIPVSDDLRLIVFRAISEALTNIEKHAYASRVSIRVFAEGAWLAVNVEDNGIGTHDGPRRSDRTLGIFGMKKRAVEFGGHLALTSRPKGGTMVRLSLPLASSDHA